MDFLDLGGLSGWALWAVYVAASTVVWIAGVYLTRDADLLAKHTRIGQAFIGLMLLGITASLPETAVAIAAATANNAELAVGSLVGGMAIHFAILAIADVIGSREALSSIVLQPSVLLQGTLCILLLATAAAGIGVDDVPFLGAGAATFVLGAGYLASVWLVRQSHQDPGWAPQGNVPADRADALAAEAEETTGQAPRSFGVVIARTAFASLVILAAGFVLARAGDGIARETGLGAGFVGVLFVALPTALPEASTVFTAVRMRNFEMAFSDVFGSNLFSLGLLLVADLLYTGRPLLGEVGPFQLFATLLALALTTIYLAGLIERRDRKVLRMGFDSLFVLGVYAAGIIILYRLR